MSRYRWALLAPVIVVIPTPSHSVDLELRCMGRYTTLRDLAPKWQDFTLRFDFSRGTVAIIAMGLPEIGVADSALAIVTKVQAASIEFETRERSSRIPSMPQVSGAVNRTDGAAHITVPDDDGILGGRCHPAKPIF